MVLAGVIAVANKRFITDAIDGSRNNKNVEIHLRYLQNTLEQFVLLFTSHLVLCTFLNNENIKLIPILVALFVIARIIFWIGYLKTPIARAFGFAATMYPIFFVLAYDIFKIFNLFG